MTTKSTSAGGKSWLLLRPAGIRCTDVPTLCYVFLSRFHSRCRLRHRRKQLESLLSGSQLSRHSKLVPVWFASDTTMTSGFRARRLYSPSHLELEPFGLIGTNALFESTTAVTPPSHYPALWRRSVVDRTRWCADVSPASVAVSLPV